MSNCKTRAWKKLTGLTGKGDQGLSYRDATTEDIINNIKKKELLINLKHCNKIQYENCAICLNQCNTKKNNDILILKCKHIFHHHCIRELIFIYTDDKCPLCRRVFNYKLKACKKVKNRLKKKIIKHYSNVCGRMPIEDLINLAYFLLSKNIKFSFMQEFLNDINLLDFRELSTINYCTLDDDHTCLFSNEFCDDHGHCCKDACYMNQNPITINNSDVSSLRRMSRDLVNIINAATYY